MKQPENHIFHHTPDTLAQWCAQHRQPKFRAGQILEWVYRKGVIDPSEMSNLPKGLRQALTDEMVFISGETVAEQNASDGTQKLLVQWGDYSDADHPAQPAKPENAGDIALNVIDGQDARPTGAQHDSSCGDSSRQTECVMIPALDDREDGVPARRTACISSQVGCPVGCRFCASGLGGLDGNLHAGRIVEQIWRLDRLVRQTYPQLSRDKGPDTKGISNVVFMGMGEPLANFKNVVHAVRTMTAPWGIGLGGRRVTISTVGMHKAIEKLADELDVPVTLALSLHAPNDTLRRELIPWAEYTSVDQLLIACDKWFKKTGREITLEYTLLHGVNDTDSCAGELADVAKRLRANINLIRFNEVDGVPFERPEDDRVRRFQGVLRDRGVNVHIRASRGRDIAAACGQLRHEQAAAG